MGFKVQKTKKQKIVGAILAILFFFILFCIGYFLTFFFTLSSSTHEGEKIVDGSWRIAITPEGGFGYHASQGIIFTFKDNGRYTIEYEDGEKIASGFYKLKVKSESSDKESYGVIKLLSVPFMQNFPEEWDMGELRTDIDFKFIYTQRDKKNNIIYKDKKNNIMSDTMELQTSGAIFKIVREGSVDEESYITTTGTSENTEK